MRQIRETDRDEDRDRYRQAETEGMTKVTHRGDRER